MAKEQQQWLAANAGKEFVPAKAGKRVTKTSKFEGQRVGWAFKTGDRGLGYYRDRGVALHLDTAVRPMQSLPPTQLSLVELVGAPGKHDGTESGERSFAPTDEAAVPKLQDRMASQQQQ